MGKDQVIIYCGMHGLYEKANHTGYTNDPRRAGIYERSKVEDLLGSPYSDRKNELLPVPEDHETRIAERIASLNAERDALAAQNLELRVALERLIAETDSVDAYMLEVHEAERVLTLPLPAAAAKVAEWKEKAELLEWLESIGGELYRTDSDDGSRKRWAVPGHHGAEGFDSLLSALRAARGAA